MATVTDVILQREDKQTTASGATLRQSWRVRFDSPAVTISQAEAEVAGVGDQVDGLTVNGVSAKRLPDSGDTFDIELTAASVEVTLTERRPAGAGVKWRVQVSGQSVPYQEPIDLDADIEEIRLPTGEPVTPQLVHDYHDEELTISFRSDVVDYLAVSACRGFANAAAATMTIQGQSRTFDSHTLKFVGNTYRLGFDEDGVYWDQTYTFHYRAEGWLVAIQPRSLYHLEGGKLVQNRDKDGRPLDTPQYLNIDGSDYVRQGENLPPPLIFNPVGFVSFATLLSGIAVGG